MKRILIILGVLVSLSVAAQDRLTFKGIPLGSEYDSFASELTQKGLKKWTGHSEILNWVVFYGSFAGFDECTIMVYYTPISDMVYKVSVKFPCIVTKEQSKNNFLALADGLMKYGEPEKVIGLDTYHPYVFWAFPAGTIELKTNGYLITLTYEDTEFARVYKIEKQKQEESMMDTSDL